MNKTDESLRDWMALSFVSGVGPRTAAELIDRFGSPAACFQAGLLALRSAELKPESIQELTSRKPYDVADNELLELDRLGATAIAIEDDRYPALLKQTYDPPIVLYCLGDLGRAMKQPAVSIVGSRRCSTYGRNAAEMLARELARRGVTIISGLARGIDAAAHRGAVEGRGLTVAVMGTGLDSVYPKEHKRLAEQIASSGALVTEFPLRTPPLSQNFPYRNRVISGMSRGVMVVEGAERSGSLITARMASEQGREVFAIPGNITSAKSFGPNYLIKDGAKLVQTWRDVVEELPLEFKAMILSAERGETPPNEPLRPDAALTGNELRVFSMMKTDEAVHIDHLIAKSGLKPGDLMTALLNLEMLDRIRQLPGKSFVRKL